MDYLHTLARATQKALVSAHNEFRREWHTSHQPPHASHVKPMSTLKIAQTNSTSTSTSTSNLTTPNPSQTPTITKTELNQLREALYRGKHIA